MSAPQRTTPLTVAGELDGQRVKVLDVLEKAYEEYDDATEGLLEAIAHGLLYVGDCLRNAGAP